MNETRSNEDQLRDEIDSLKRQLEAHQKPGGVKTGSVMFIGLGIVALTIAGFFLGYLPRQKREQVLAAEERNEAQSLPVVNVEPVGRSSTKSSLVLPGNIQAVTEAPVLARASGYVRKRTVDIGDRVSAGQVLAEIEAPEVDQQIKQAQAAIDQAASTVQQAQAALVQGEANTRLAKVTADRWKSLVDQGVVSRQDYDTRAAQYDADVANVQALQKAIAAAQSNQRAAEANLARLNELLGYQTVRAPFAGVITVRNIETGMLVSEGNTLLYRVAQTDRLRTYLNAPQSDAASVRIGQVATLEIPDLPGRKFSGTVARTSNALDPATRTLLVEVQVPNPSGTLVPGMYAQVDLAVPRANPPLVIPSDTLVVRSDGPQVAIVRPDGTVHFTLVQLGRDMGDHLEVLSGLTEGQQLAVNPGDAVREGARVKAVAAPPKAKK